MNESTIFMPCSYAGYFDAAYAARWGLADFDWSNGKQLWANAKPMDCEEMLVEQVRRIHDINPKTKTFVYRNFVKALPWFTTVREKLDDPAYSGFFLRFKEGGFFPNGSYHVPQCTGSKCSQFYHDQDQTPEHPKGDGSCKDECDCGTQPCGEYLFDHRNGTMLREFIVNEMILGPSGLGAAGVKGFYFDDNWFNHSAKTRYCAANAFGGPTEEDRWCVDDMGLTAPDVQAIYDGWQETVSAVQDAVLAAGGFSWQYLSGVTPPQDSASCKAFFSQQCHDASPMQTSASVMFWHFANTTANLTQPDVDLASFLLARGPYAWLGYTWNGCSSDARPDSSKGPYALPSSTQVDYGEPVDATCSETSPGVFSRRWSKASVTMDCNTMSPSIAMAS